MIRQTSAAAILGFTTIAVCLFGCRPEPIAPSPNAPAPNAPAPNAQSSNAAPPAETAALPEPADTQAVPPPEPADAQAVAPAEYNLPEPVPIPTSTTEEGEPVEVLESDEPQARTAFYRADTDQPAAIPTVVLSNGHEALCRVKVGDTMPNIELDQLGGERRSLADLFGTRATVVVFWKSDRHMARQQLADLGPDVLAPFGESGVAVVGIAVNEPAARAQDLLQQAAARFPNLLDENGDAFAQVGSEKLPRTYLLDPQGKILWFDIEYSLATRRELHRALRAVAESE